MVVVLLMQCLGVVAMDGLPEKPLFTPNVFEGGADTAWGFDHDGDLSMNKWFIAGPAPGVHRDEWLEVAKTFRQETRAGNNRILELYAGGDGAYLYPAPMVTAALALEPGETLFVAVRVRGKGERDMALTVGFASEGATAPMYVDETDGLCVPGDGAWHDLETMVTVPEDVGSGPPVTPFVVLNDGGAQKPGRIEVASVVLGVDDLERMKAVNRLLQEQGNTQICRGIYDRSDLAWASSAYTHYFVFVYDSRFYDQKSGYQVAAFLEDTERRFGGVDAVVLWPAYPRIGVDARNQFDFFRDMPGGLEGVRAVCRQLREHGVRVLIPYLPWDDQTRREDVTDTDMLAKLVSELGADGVFLDTLTTATPEIRRRMDETERGVVLVPELCPPVEQVSLCNASWAQWPEDLTPPGIPLLRWIEPRHTQHYTRRWSRSHRWEMETAFSNGAGMLLWENIFGTHNPCSAEDAFFWKRCVSILRTFHKAFSSDLWDPFYPSLHHDVFIHRWPGAPTTLFTLRNMGEPVEHGLLIRWQLPAHIRADDMRIHDVWRGQKARWDMSEFGWVQIWGDIKDVACFAVTFGDDPKLDDLLTAQAALLAEEPPEEQAAVIAPELRVVAPATSVSEDVPDGMVRVPGGTVNMHLTHQRREFGCYPDPGADKEATEYFIWGSPHDELLTHKYSVEVAPYYIDEAQVTNREFKQFLDETDYEPEHGHKFLHHWPDGRMPAEIAELPVVYVDLDDARAYARWAGKRLPTEPEWQWAAQGDDGRRWPWGDSFDADKCPPAGDSPMPVRSLPESRSPFGCYLMAGNVWEWTESERDDGITRFCIIRGGSYYHIEGSGWYVQGGPQPLDTHTKFLLMWPGLDRCATIGFRCVRDVNPAG